MKDISQKRRDFVLRLGQAIGVAGVSMTPQVFAKGDRGRANLKSVVLNQSANGQQRLLFELDKSIKHKVLTLTSPDRIAIDFLNTQSKASLKLGRNKKQRLIKNLRYSVRKNTDYRVVLDMSAKTKVTSWLSKKDSKYFLEVVLSPQQANKKTPEQKVVKAISAVGRAARRKPMVIVIDAGHGGKDPGAIGRKGTKEKHIALQIAKRLKKHIDRQPGMKGVLVRNEDRYIRLRKRIEKARKYRADLFISIHADANPDHKLSGSSVYILSENGASSEAARWLAKNENSYEEKLAGTHLVRKNKVLSSLLLDLSLSDTIDRSLELASGVLKELGSVNHLLRSRVESAGFVVLKSPDIPSMLVETAFLSNAREEKRLKNARHQEKLAKAIFKGVRRYQLAMNDSDSRYT